VAQGGAAAQRTERWRGAVKRAVTAVVAVTGRPLQCEMCGKQLFRSYPFVWRGRLKLRGAEVAEVRADWDKNDRLTFRHVEAEKCRG